MLRFSRILNCLRSAWQAVCDTTVHLRGEYIVEHYLRAGAAFGDALSLIYQGECGNLEGRRAAWADLERQYAALGYRTIPVEDFIEYGGYGKSVDHLLRVLRARGEDPVYHADVFHEKLAQGLTPLIEFGGDGRPTCTFRRAEGKSQPKGRDKPSEHECDCKYRFN